MEKDGTGSCTTKPKSEWRTKKSGKKRPYWERWNDENDNQYTAKWNGFYWVNLNTGLRTMANGLTPKHKVVAWYMYEKYNPNDLV